MRRIVLVRHGRTAWNAARRIQGSTDLPLDDEGRAQAVEAAAQLVALGSWTHVVSSPLLRARETATIVARELRLPLRPPVAALVERNFGQAEGLTVDEAGSRWPDLAYPGAETDLQLGRRVAAAIARIAAEVRTPLTDGAIVVSHGQALRRGIEALTGEPMPRIVNAQAVVLERMTDGNGAPSWRRAADRDRAMEDVAG